MGMAFTSEHKNKPRIAIAGLAIESSLFTQNMFLLDKNTKESDISVKPEPPL
jgi:hypothetical protein